MASLALYDNLDLYNLLIFVGFIGVLQALCMIVAFIVHHLYLEDSDRWSINGVIFPLPH
jgi:hypothetical protein